MFWMLRLVVAFSLAFLARPAEPQALEPEFQLSAAGEAAVGEEQLWYLSAAFPEDGEISELRIENGSPEAWDFAPIELAAPAAREALPIRAVAKRAGSFRPRLLLSYSAAGQTVRRVVEGQPVSIGPVEDRLELELVSASAEVDPNRPGWLTALVRNRSPFAVEVSLSVVDGRDRLPSPGVKPFTLAAGETRPLRFDFALPRSGELLVEAEFTWSDRLGLSHTAVLQRVAGPVAMRQNPWTQSLPTLAGVVTGGLISLFTTLLALWFTQQKENRLRHRYEEDQALGLLDIIFLYCRRAYEHRQPIDLKYLDELLLKHQLYRILVDRKMDAVTQKLWVAAQFYNRQYESQRTTESYAQLAAALQDFEKALQAMKTNPPKL